MRAVSERALMVFGPYQSKLLRFAIAQYRYGIERHRKAILQTHTTVIRGAMLGGAWALVPVKGAVMLARRVADRLKLIAAPRKTRLSSMREDKITQVVASASECLSAQQVAELQQSIVNRRVRGPFVLSVLWLRNWLNGLAYRSNQTSDQTSNQINKSHQTRLDCSISNGTTRITGFASDLETQRLVLVLDYDVVWDGLSAAQQRLINDKIAALLTVRRRTIQTVNVLGDRYALSVVDDQVIVRPRWMQFWMRSPLFSYELSQSIRSFWVEVLWAVANLRRRKQQLPAEEKRLKDYGYLWRKIAGSQPRLCFLRGDNAYQRALPFLAQVYIAGSEGLEADVISVSYVEHPLESVLNWLDRKLLWLERLWTAVVDWLHRVKQAIS